MTIAVVVVVAVVGFTWLTLHLQEEGGMVTVLSISRFGGVKHVFKVFKPIATSVRLARLPSYFPLPIFNNLSVYLIAR